MLTLKKMYVLISTLISLIQGTTNNCTLILSTKTFEHTQAYDTMGIYVLRSTSLISAVPRYFYIHHE